MIYIGNKIGGYLSLSKELKSKYEGVFFSGESTLYKVIENIKLTNKNKLITEIQDISTALRKWDNGTNEVFSYHHNTLLYTKNSSEEIELLLDVKKGYDSREYGRQYIITNYELRKSKDIRTASGGCGIHAGKKSQKTSNNMPILVRFSKRNDEREAKGDEYNMYIAINLFGAKYELTEVFQEQPYQTDEQRGDVSDSRYVYSLLKTTAQKMSLSFGTDREKVIQEVLRETPPLTKERGGSTSDIPPVAIDFAKNALKNLVADMYGRTGILAGHPWFFQYWTRDEAISAWGLYLSGKEKEAKKVLLNAIEHINSDGRISNRIPEADIECADGVGWTFFRLYQVHKDGGLTKKEKIQIEKQLRLSLARMEELLLDDGLTTNKRLETWMDTDYKNDDRAGKRIEIQALTLAMYNFLFALSGDSEVHKKEKEMRKVVKKSFWSGSYLKDGSDDDTIRPNIFLAYYVYSDLLSKKEWGQCFDIAMKKLWLKWGGFSTIEKENPLFCSSHSGQNNRSYHRGDSWYFVNNIAALCLLKLNKKYVQYSKKIYQASEKDILSGGALGCVSEISSAEKQTHEGCFNQAWSNATFIELHHELFISQQGGFK